MPALATLPNHRMPRHVAIIMDGNGRWAKARGLPRIAGHRHGTDAVRRVVRGARDLGIRYLTLYGFSSENWKRPLAEVDDLMGLMRRFLQSEIAELDEAGVRLRVIGERGRLSPDIVRLIADAEALTRDHDQLTLTVAISYGGRQEIVSASRRLAREVAAGSIDPESIDEDRFADCLLTADMPDPDLVIRTSGEQRISNFLLWQSAYSELVFTDKLWPDFSVEDLAEAIREYQRRDRRYGALVSSA